MNRSKLTTFSLLFLCFFWGTQTVTNAQSYSSNSKGTKLPRYECDGKIYVEPCDQNKENKVKPQPAEESATTIASDDLTEEEKQAQAILEYDRQQKVLRRKSLVLERFESYLKYYQKNYNIMPREAKEVKAYCQSLKVTKEQCEKKIADVKMLLTDYEIKWNLDRGKYFKPHDKKWRKYKEAQKEAMSNKF